MEVTWRAGWENGWGVTHLLLADKGNLTGPFCTNLWHYKEWKEDPNPEICKWCLEAERWIRLVEGEPLDILKRIPGYSPTIRKHALTLEDER